MFARRLEKERRDLLEHIRISRLNPVITIDNIDEEQADWCRKHLAGSAELFEDIQFQPFATKEQG